MSIPFDASMIKGQYTSHNLWCLLALRDAIRVARGLGKSEDEKAWMQFHQSYGKAIMAALYASASKRCYEPTGLYPFITGPEAREGFREHQTNQDWENNLPDVDTEGADGFNQIQKLFYNEFITSLIKTLTNDYPQLDFYASLDSGMPLKEIDISQFSAIDNHIWFAHHGSIPGLGQISSRDQKLELRSIYYNLLTHWKEHKESLIAWMDHRLTTISGMAAKYQIPCGNTEGWGPIFWYDHSELDWKWVKEAAEGCIDLALKHDNYKFLCTSNFTHPQFAGMWDDIKWHRK